MGHNKLTPKQEEFARDVASGMTQVDAFKKHYSHKPNTTSNSLYVSASQVANKPKVALRIKELQAEYGDKTSLTSRDEQLQMLLQTQSIAAAHLQKVTTTYDANGEPAEESAFNKGAADTIIRAAEAINKMCGFNEPEQVDNKIVVAYADNKIKDYSS